MDEQFQHRMLPEATHDELARQNFVNSLKGYIGSQISPGNKELYEKQLKPRFEQENQRPPKDRYEVRRLMQHEPSYRMWGALRRTTQEMLWDAVNISVERQINDLIEQAQDKASACGSLTLNPDLKIPAYHTAVDIHCMPGGYHSEYIQDDVAAGAIYDRGVYVYVMGRLGPLNDDMGQSVVRNYLQPQHPNFRPAKILDMGCSVGHSTLPYVDAYPDAEVYAIDVASPMLRYAHARAEALQKRVHFSQQNAEHTNFPDESFDLIVSHILLHEASPGAIANILRECHRLLVPGGLMVHAEAPQYNNMDAYSAFMFDWETQNNNEPWWSAMRDLDLVEMTIKAGFEPDKIIPTVAANGAWKNSGQSGGFGSRGNWSVLVASK
ncbi:class I SAM-dependent methyltransferase [Microcoleus sp. FACHB-831]|uniref:class I SAM-dependent methyltransferase n=1 Tax=Microcoleus sp. FACHB-831 TaxID=2692827 RepID=UPI0016888C9C|nr:class I SAM-dependent methyltransferase [Microcoleus sp. FACHB-831]MBD1923346.1 class I SAM-dependent methyltransferase [Microcoleus sp. FACHB-831]